MLSLQNQNHNNNNKPLYAFCVVKVAKNQIKMDKKQVAIFENEEFGKVRVLGTPEEPMFVASDVANALGYKNTRDAIAKHVDDVDKADVAIHDGRQNRTMTIINESGVYALIFGSKLERAKKFKHWVTSEVLPVIRKQGYYGNNEAFCKLAEQYGTLCNTMANQYGTICNAVELIAKTQQQTNEMLSMIVDTVKIMAHHVLQPNQNQNQTKPSLQPYQINKKDTYTASEICSAFGFQSAQQLNNELVRRGIISRDRYNLDITPEYADKGIAILKRFNFRGKEINTYVVWTSQGIDFLKSIL